MKSKDFVTVEKELLDQFEQMFNPHEKQELAMWLEMFELFAENPRGSHTVTAQEFVSLLQAKLDVILKTYKKNDLDLPRYQWIQKLDDIDKQRIKPYLKQP